MTTSWEDAAREALANGKKNDPLIDTIELNHVDTATELFYVRDFQEHDFTLEDGFTVQTFLRAGFQVETPATASQGLQQMAIRIDNINLEASDFINEIKHSKTPVNLVYRQYLLSEPTIPARRPLRMLLTNFKITIDSVVAKATIQDIVNTPMIAKKYNKELFPGLR
ncbi:MAG: hypothetical protein CMI54_05680 [Parcubacteria group bacterium]|jgi:hypothetical protein|nr:hypothetical protein [Parcubacteria group bacterium]|tara:strand:- start:16010 stop:16510 length:501 start_codon:yes stop_codon:yes gene_type:complete